MGPVNSFEAPGVSLTCSVARISGVTGAFVGHIAGMRRDGRPYRFATYPGAKLALVETWAGGARVTLRAERTEIDLRAEGGAAGEPKVPVLGAMKGRVGESLGAGPPAGTARRPAVVFEGKGRCAGLEVVGARGELVADD